MQPTHNQIEAITKQSAEARYRYALKHMLHTGEIWLLTDNEGWFMYEDDAETAYVPVWPARVYAQLNATADWSSAKPERFDLEEFLLGSVPELLEQNTKVAVFPVPNSTQTSESDIRTFCENLNQLALETYGETFDLPYLNE